MPVIDVHTHIFPDHVAPYAIPALAEEAGITAFADGTLAGQLAMMKRSGVDRAVIQPVATKANQVGGVNDWAASLASDEIVAFGAMHPDLEDPAAEIARMASLGLRGFKMHPEYQSFAPDEPRMEPVLRAARTHGMTILFHAGLDAGPQSRNGTPEAFARMLDANPGLCVILAHMGGWRVWKGVREHLAGRDIYLDTAYTLDHLPHDEFLELVRVHGSDRVLFGSDAPWTDMGFEIAALRSLGLPEKDLEAILGGNAERMLAEAEERVRRSVGV